VPKLEGMISETSDVLQAYVDIGYQSTTNARATSATDNLPGSALQDCVE
jgi:hypothetical protein